MPFKLGGLFYGGLVGSGNERPVFAVLVYRMATFRQTQCLRRIRWTRFRAWRGRPVMTGVLAASRPGWADGVSVMDPFGVRKPDIVLHEEADYQDL